MGHLRGGPVSSARSRVKEALGRVPAAAEAYQAVLASGKQPQGGYRLDRLREEMPGWVADGLKARQSGGPLPAKKILVVASLPWWLEYGAAVSVLLAGSGCDVGMGFVPYRTWTDSVQTFDRRRQSANIRRVLAPLTGLARVHDLSGPAKQKLGTDLMRSLEQLSLSDVQYTLQREDAGVEGEPEGADLFQLRLERNLAAASAILDLIQHEGYQVVLIPNGSILEFGAAFRAARSIGATAVTYEFGEQRERLWLAQNEEVMRQNTDDFWTLKSEQQLSQSEKTRLEAMYAARRSGLRWDRFDRQWQSAPSRGAVSVSAELGIHTDGPVALLCTNVVGDSLALNRQVFTKGMADWLALTVKYFEDPRAGQLVVRVHPGEMLGAGHPSAAVVRQALPDLPKHVIVVGADSQINTYDLIELADVGLVYTSTVGLEMAMADMPVVVAGQTHYRGKGFTFDPETPEEYIRTVERLIAAASNGEQVAVAADLAAQYAYRFFFEYPFPFPWHLIGFWGDIKERPMGQVLSDPEEYRESLSALVGEPTNWSVRNV